jgi:ribosomal protein S18 acetylase RimI-like enzyme
MTGADVTLRPLRDDDGDFSSRVYAATREEELAAVFSPAQKAAFLAQQSAAQTAHYARQHAGMSSHVVLVDAEPAGRLLVARWTHEIRIVDIALLPEYRGAGVGTRLLGSLIEESEAAGKPLTIHVERANPARRLYDRLGFVPVADRGLYLLMERPASRDRVEVAS